jgi:hypothetical protein
MIDPEASRADAERRQQAILAGGMPEPDEQGGGEHARRVGLDRSDHLHRGVGDPPAGHAVWEYSEGGQQAGRFGNGLELARREHAEPLADGQRQPEGSSGVAVLAQQVQEFPIEFVNLPSDLCFLRLSLHLRCAPVEIRLYYKWSKWTK